jgi:RNA polymerase sigma-70 factor (ECF subfamily)
MLILNATTTQQFDDSILLRQINKGCKQSFNRLYEKHWERAYEYAFKRLQDSEQAKDIVQEIFTHIWLKREVLEIENLHAYMNVAVRNQVLKFLARQKTSHPFFKVLENLPCQHVDTDASVLAKEFNAAYQALVKTLPSKKQMIFRLRYEEELPTKDIARFLNISRKTVQNQLGKAIEQLRLTLLLILIESMIFIAF